MISKVLTFLLILYLCYRLLRFFFRPILAFLAKRAIRKAAQGQGYAGKQKRYRQPDGSIRIDHVPPKNKQQQPEFKGGEYVDYEELNKRK